MATKKKTQEPENTEKELKTKASSKKKTEAKSAATKKTSSKSASKAETPKTTRKKSAAEAAESKTKTTKSKTSAKADAGKKTSAKTAKTAAAKTTSTKKSTSSRARTKKAAATTPTISEAPAPREIREETLVGAAPTDVREHYFQEHRGAPPLPEVPELPSEYGDTKIVLLVRDPEWVYAYWEINDAVRAEYNLPRHGHSRRMVIRLYNITGRNWPTENAHYFFDIDISPYANNWYIKVPEPDQQWVAELGTFDERGEYLPIVQSNIVRTPRDRMSDETDADWMVVEETWQKIYGMSGALRPLDSSWAGSEELLRHLQKQVYPALRGEGGFAGSGALGSANVAVQPKPGAAKPSAFWLRTETELILYGATEPDASVTVNGEAVVLRSDGSFTLRFALPDGEHQLEVRALSRDGNHQRDIAIHVKKQTK
ncbi:MAG: DUF4912 domain-containing protein [Candidatus Sumerlaea chitinivorans]|jgi:hypothetical protein|nr:DUF4912 domain-containing protein [Candidatus Sumerlaea chitinivorans]